MSSPVGGIERGGSADRARTVAEVVRAAEATFALELEAPAILRQGRAMVVRATSSNGRTTGPVIIKQFGGDPG